MPQKVTIDDEEWEVVEEDSDDEWTVVNETVEPPTPVASTAKATTPAKVSTTKPAEEKSLLRKGWETISSPLTDAPSRFARSVSEYIDPERSTTGPRAYASAFVEGLGDVVSGLTSPIDLGAAALSGGASMAGKAGLAKIAKTAAMGSRVASAPVAAHGATELFGSDKTTGERAFGAAEMGAGILGMKGGLGKIKPTDKAVDLGPSPSAKATVDGKPVPQEGDFAKAKQVIQSYEGGLQKVMDKTDEEIIEYAEALDPGFRDKPGRIRPVPGVDFNVDPRDAGVNFSTKAEADAAMPAPDKPVTSGPDATPSSAKPKTRINKDGTYTDLSNPAKRYDSYGNPVPGAVEKISAALTEAKPLEKQQAGIYTKERAGKIAAAKDFEVNTEQDFYRQLGALKGEHTKVGTEPLRGQLEQNDIDDVFKIIQKHQEKDEFSKIHARTAFIKLLGGEVPTASEQKVLSNMLGIDLAGPDKKKLSSLITEAINVPKAFWSSMDMSAPLRQGLSLIHRKEWWKSLDDMFKSAWSEENYRAIMDGIEGDADFNFSQTTGLKLTDLGKLSQREEAFISRLPEKAEQWVYEKVKGATGIGTPRLFRGSSRAYTGFLDKLRYDTYKGLIADAQRSGLNPRKDLKLAKSIAEYVNNATGRGDLGRFEKIATELNTVLFSPRLIASRVQMMNPQNYVMGPTFARKQYLKSLLSTSVAWGSVSSLGYMSGLADVSLDPSSSDFGKMRIGNTRLDPAGGYQQYLVAAYRFASGQSTSPVSDKTTDLDEGKFGMATRGTIPLNLARSKASPVAALAIDLMSAQKDFAGRPVNVPGRLVDMFIPLIAQDAYEIWKEDPEALPAVGAAFFGMGTQSYEQGGSRDVPSPSLGNFAVDAMGDMF